MTNEKPKHEMWKSFSKNETKQKYKGKKQNQVLNRQITKLPSQKIFLE